MPYRPQPASLSFAPTAYPEPDWEQIGMVSRVYSPPNNTIGWLVLQGEHAIAWLSSVGPDHDGYGIRLYLDHLLRDNVEAGRSVRETWERALADTLHTIPADDLLSALIADIRKGWGPG